MNTPPFSFRADLLSEGVGDMLIQVVLVPPLVVLAFKKEGQERGNSSRSSHQ